MKPNPQSGNILLYILIAIVMIGLLTVALRDTGGMSGDVDKENASVQAAQIIKYGGEISQGIQTIVGNGASENDIRFSFPGVSGYGTITTNPTFQVFSSQGGQASYRTAPKGSNDGSAWEFIADYNMYQTGSSKADLIALLPNINVNVCNAINSQLGISTLPVVNNCIVNPTRFTGVFASSPVSMAYSSGTPTQPLLQVCIQCSSDSYYRFVTTVLAR